MSDFNVFNLPRTIACLGVIWYHTTCSTVLLNPARSTELLSAWWNHQILSTLDSIGPLAADLFFTIAGFFITMKLVLMMEARMSMWRFVVYRWLTLVPIHLCLLLVAVVFADPVFWKDGFDWARVLTMFGTRNYALKDWFDFSTMPTWATSVDLHGTIVLAVLLPALRQLNRNPVHLLWMCVFVCINIRGMVLATNPTCLLWACVRPSGSSLPAVGEGFITGLEERYGWIRANKTESICDFCALNAQEQLFHYLKNMVLPSHVRLAPFFLGSILFFEYSSSHQARTSTNKRIWNAWSSLLIGPSLLWIFHVHRALPRDFSLLLTWLVPTAFAEGVEGALYSASWCGLLFCTLVPVEHPAHSFPTRRLLAYPLFRSPARFSLGLCFFHWPVLWALRASTPAEWWIPPESTTLAALLPFFAVLVCTAPFAVAFEILIQKPWAGLVRRVVLKDMPSIRAPPLPSEEETRDDSNKGEKKKAKKKKQS